MSAALMLTQLLYWTGKEADPEGWIHKVEADWEEELVFGARRLRDARSILVGLGLVEHTRRGLPARPCYRVRMDVLDEWWSTHLTPSGGPVNTTAKEPDNKSAKEPDKKTAKRPDIPYYRDDFIDDLQVPRAGHGAQPPAHSISEEAIYLCDLLADLIESNGSKRPNVTALRWLTEADRLIRVDGRDPAAAAALIRWCQADTFWRPNIMSMAKFREKYDQLRLASQRNTGQQRATGLDAVRQYAQEEGLL